MISSFTALFTRSKKGSLINSRKFNKLLYEFRRYLETY